jgi:hypothetical protein
MSKNRIGLPISSDDTKERTKPDAFPSKVREYVDDSRSNNKNKYSHHNLHISSFSGFFSQRLSLD